mmetsp:Transcript_3348/g.7310  ORF Transcript_3348/g.7310 Transcript_3348/m.7310 type:complete len:437 (+) Transcript_3348:277-1587(+)|eukprot:CAMPEP_0202892396 /NCGR_PEP_ID=MMETSP1392-20130828/2108_1 /ASSEMBLY_ACC=CAM_ASM_000868 /TAXON_ID=225041 /ORGANISM="Chlamydomonas chlamydogama, Strain SAG 11-48b" /LENGTH=436 /DNA_ID=CAMNT_0049576329 /DNA_START=190 /DNA_END=1500 /DNA_ORIENTATION=+
MGSKKDHKKKKKKRPSPDNSSESSDEDQIVIKKQKKHKGVERKGDEARQAPVSEGGDNCAKDDQLRQKLLKLSSKLEKTKDPAKQQQLQAKLMALMAIISKQAAAARPAPAATPPAARVIKPPGFQFKHTVTPSSGIMGKDKVSLLSAEEKLRRHRRQQRFGALDDMGGSTQDVLLAEARLGTCESLEKEYLRLTSLPMASTVRPPHILELALRLVKAKWVQTQDYKYACEQLKSIRQDLTVQHVRDVLTVDAYETHGRVALEVGDTAEFRQCHAVLKQLYKEGVPGSMEEFVAYGLLFTLCTGSSARQLLASELMEVPPAAMEHPYVRHSLAVCRAFRAGDYHTFMSLFEGAPRMTPYLMDRLLPHMQRWALQVMLVAYRPTAVPLEHIAAELGMEEEGEVVAFIQEHGGVVNTDAKTLNTQLSAAKPSGPPRPA